MAYEKLDQISHILKRSDMYVGSTRMLNDDEWVFDQDKIQKREIEYNPGLLRIFVEVLSNVIDNVWRSQEQSITTEKISIMIDNEMISVTNDGRGIPFTNYKDTDIPIPELIFGHLLTSTNYNDQEERLTSGRNGLGVKLTNVFSKKFEIELHNKDTQQIYKQKWENHMRKCHSPSIKSKAVKSNMVCIKFYPDFSCFGLDGMTPDILSMFSKYCVDTAMITKLPVTLNKDKIKIKQFMDYVKMYPVNSKECIVLEKKEDMDLVLCSSDNGYQEIVFTNGVFNKQGGVHIDNIMNEICKSLLTKINTKLKSSLTVKDLKPHFTVFLNCKLVNPSFNNQSKDRLMSPNIKYKFDPKYVANIMKWEFVEKIKENIQMKELKTIKKMERKRVRIEGYDPANLSGTKRSSECTLILSEGLSAKTFAVTGIQQGYDGKKGRDYFGILPLSGKLLNVRNATLQSIMNNKVIMDLANVLNLKYNQENKIEDLNYGRVLILTDADVDGIHIASLILNVFDVLYPSLLKKPFIYLMVTPIAKVQNHTFYSDYEYQKFLAQNEKKQMKVKYFKGLGTCSTSEVKEAFGKKVVRYLYDEKAKETLNKVFHHKFSTERKEWMEKYNPDSYLPIEDDCHISNYIDHELIRYSIDDCRRNIPNLFDGQKLSQRKILYSILKKGLHYKNPSMKVAQLAGYVAEVSNYHHGEQCLFDTIIKMTHSFVGSQNLPLLYPDGQFGTRSYNGKDAANGRYIFTKLQKYSSDIFSKDDQPLLNYLYDDNDLVEPEYYMPILPLILVNGCNTGIGTGWSCNLPCYNPSEIIEEIEKWIDCQENQQKYTFPKLVPYWEGYKGRIEKIDESKFVSYGCFTEDAKGKCKIDELPIGVWTDKYKEFLEGLVDEKKIRNFKNHSTTDTVHFEFQTCPGFELSETTLKLSNTIHLTNMVLFTKNHKLQKFKNIGDIFKTFCNERYDFYESRKQYKMGVLKRLITTLKNRLRFLKMILSNELVLNKYEDEELVEILETHKFKKEEGSFTYLLEIPIRQMTKTRLIQIEKEINTTTHELDVLQERKIGDIWKSDLNIFKEDFQKKQK
jgi:DNA topoisomerase II